MTSGIEIFLDSLSYTPKLAQLLGYFQATYHVNLVKYIDRLLQNLTILAFLHFRNLHLTFLTQNEQDTFFFDKPRQYKRKLTLTTFGFGLLGNTFLRLETFY